MRSLADAFAALAERVSAVTGSPFYDAEVIDQAEQTLDSGGSVAEAGEPVRRTCRVQVDLASYAMRTSEGFTDGDCRFIILAAALDGTLSTDAEVDVTAGDDVPADIVGLWQVSSIERDPAGIGYVGRGRKA